MAERTPNAGVCDLTAATGIVSNAIINKVACGFYADCNANTFSLSMLIILETIKLYIGLPRLFDFNCQGYKVCHSFHSKVRRLG